MKPAAAAIRISPDAIGVAAVASCGAAMAAWTWGSWPDPIVDFGSQLYNAWQLSRGKVLYRDLAYFNGPLSQYFNAVMFRCFGVGLWTIAWANLVIAAISAGMIYLILRKIGSTLTATMGGISFFCLFAFGRFDKIGNFNWICPYRQEVTHGMAMSLAAMLCVARYGSSGRRIWPIAAGILCGLVFLTKAENFFPLALAIIVGIVTVARNRRHLLLLVASAVLPVAAALLMLATVMPWRSAVMGTLGSLPWMFDSRIAALDFYRQGMGLLDVRQSTIVLLKWTLGYVAVFGIAVIWGFTIVPKRRWIWIAPAAIFASVIAWCVLLGGPRINWLNVAAPLPVVVLLALVLPPLPEGEGRNSERRTLRIAFSVFALATLGRMFLDARITDYGFALAMPAFMVAIDLFAGRLPAWMSRIGRNGSAATAMAVAAWAALLGIYLAVMAVYVGEQTVAVGSGTDRFWADRRGAEVNAALLRLQQFDPRWTLAVLPQGRMLNYLSRRRNSVWLGDFMPPEVISLGESAALAAMQNNPPDIVILTGKDVRGDWLNFPIGDYRYGKPTLDWVFSHYRPVGPPPKPEDELRFTFLISERR